MSVTDKEPGLAVRLRPRKSVASPQYSKTTRKISQISQDNKPLKATTTPSKMSLEKHDDHAKKSDSSPTTQFSCPYCEKIFSSKQMVTKHVHHLHLTSSRPGASFSCIFCTHTETSSTVVRHMIYNQPNQYYACLDCHNRFLSTYELVKYKLNVCEKMHDPYRIKLRHKEPTAIKAGKKLLCREFKGDLELNEIVISCELKSLQMHNDNDDNIRSDLMLPPSNNVAQGSGLNKVTDTVVGDIQCNKRNLPNILFHNNDSDQILSRLGVVHRSPQTGESTRRVRTKNMDNFPVKFEKCFETSFYSKVASNVHENLTKFLDGSFNFSPDPANAIKTRKANSSVAINTAEGFPILLAREQHSRGAFDGYMPRTLAPKHKWKWDHVESEKTLLSVDNIKRDSHTNNCVVTSVSSLDIWSQLRMRRKFEAEFGAEPVEKKTEKNNIMRQELKEILESREIPSPSHALSSRGTPKSRSGGWHFLDSLGLRRETSRPPLAPATPAVLSGEWVRPRCHVCCACGSLIRDPRSLSRHLTSQHPHAQVQHYDIVGERLLNADILKHLYVPPNRVTNRTRPPRGIRECTKCQKTITPEELHQHMLDCAGDSPIVRRRQCRYRPFGMRRRRSRLPDNNNSNSGKKSTPDHIRSGLTHQNEILQSRSNIARGPEVEKAETIRKMLPDLPATRHRVLATKKAQRSRKTLDTQLAVSTSGVPRETCARAVTVGVAYGSSRDSDNTPKFASGQGDEHKPLKPKLLRLVRQRTRNNARTRNVTLRRRSIRVKHKKIKMKPEQKRNADTQPLLRNEIETNKADCAGQSQDLSNNSMLQINCSNGIGDSTTINQVSLDLQSNNSDFKFPAEPSCTNGNIIETNTEVLKMNSDTGDKSAEVEQLCDNTNEHAHTGPQELVKSEAVASKFDEPPIKKVERSTINIHTMNKNKRYNPKKNLNACITMLEKKLMDPLITKHVSVQCGSDEPMSPVYFGPRSSSRETMIVSPGSDDHRNTTPKKLWQHQGLTIPIEAEACSIIHDEHTSLALVSQQRTDHRRHSTEQRKANHKLSRLNISCEQQQTSTVKPHVTLAQRWISPSASAKRSTCTSIVKPSRRESMTLALLHKTIALSYFQELQHMLPKSLELLGVGQPPEPWTRSSNRSSLFWARSALDKSYMKSLSSAQLKHTKSGIAASAEDFNRETYTNRVYSNTLESNQTTNSLSYDQVIRQEIVKIPSIYNNPSSIAYKQSIDKMLPMHALTHDRVDKIPSLHIYHYNRTLDKISAMHTHSNDRNIEKMPRILSLPYYQAVEETAHVQNITYDDDIEEMHHMPCEQRSVPYERTSEKINSMGGLHCNQSIVETYTMGNNNFVKMPAIHDLSFKPILEKNPVYPSYNQNVEKMNKFPYDQTWILSYPESQMYTQTHKDICFDNDDCLPIDLSIKTLSGSPYVLRAQATSSIAEDACQSTLKTDNFQHQCALSSTIFHEKSNPVEDAQDSTPPPRRKSMFSHDDFLVSACDDVLHETGQIQTENQPLKIKEIDLLQSISLMDSRATENSVDESLTLGAVQTFIASKSIDNESRVWCRQRSFLNNLMSDQDSYKYGHTSPPCSVDNSVFEDKNSVTTAMANTFIRSTAIEHDESAHAFTSVTVSEAPEIHVASQKELKMEIAEFGTKSGFGENTKLIKKKSGINVTIKHPKIAMLPREVLEIILTMSMDHRNQLLNLWPQYIATTIALPLSLRDTVDSHTSFIYRNTRGAIMPPKIIDDQSVIHPSEVTVRDQSSSTALTLSLPVPKAIQISDDNVQMSEVNKTNQYEISVTAYEVNKPVRVRDLVDEDIFCQTIKLVPPAATRLVTVDKSIRRKSNNDQTANLRAVRIRPQTNRQKVSIPFHALETGKIIKMQSEESLGSAITDENFANMRFHACTQIIKKFENSNNHSEQALHDSAPVTNTNIVPDIMAFALTTTTTTSKDKLDCKARNENYKHAYTTFAIADEPKVLSNNQTSPTIANADCSILNTCPVTVQDYDPCKAFKSKNDHQDDKNHTKLFNVKKSDVTLEQANSEHGIYIAATVTSKQYDSNFEPNNYYLERKRRGKKGKSSTIVESHVFTEKVHTSVSNKASCEIEQENDTLEINSDYLKSKESDTDPSPDCAKNMSRLKKNDSQENSKKCKRHVAVASSLELLPCKPSDKKFSLERKGKEKKTRKRVSEPSSRNTAEQKICNDVRTIRDCANADQVKTSINCEVTKKACPNVVSLINSKKAKPEESNLVKCTTMIVKKLKMNVNNSPAAEITTVPLRRSRRSKSLFNEITETGSAIPIQTESDTDEKLPKKQLISSKLAEENRSKRSISHEASTHNSKSVSKNDEKSLTNEMKGAGDLNLNKKRTEDTGTDKDKPAKHNKSLPKQKCKRKQKSFHKAKLSLAPETIYSNKIINTPLNNNVDDYKIIQASDHDKSDDHTQCSSVLKRKQLVDVLKTSSAKKSKSFVQSKQELNIEDNATAKNEGIPVKELGITSKSRSATCYDMPKAARQTPSKSVAVKSSSTIQYDPYDIDLDDMNECEPLCKTFKLIDHVKLSKLKSIKCKESKIATTNINDSNEDKRVTTSICNSCVTNNSTNVKESFSDNNGTDIILNIKTNISATSKRIKKMDASTQKICIEKDNSNDSDFSSKSAHSLKINIDEQEKILFEEFAKDLENEIDAEVIKKSCDSKVVPDKETTKLSQSEEHMKSFGFFLEKKPRKSNLIACQKIAQTFHTADESDDVFLRRIPKKNKAGKKTSASDISSILVSTFKTSERGRKQKSIPAPKPKKKDYYCSACKKTFARMDNLMRHRLTYIHASKLSHSLLKFDVSDSEKPNYCVAFKVQMDKFRLLAASLKGKKRPKIKLPSLQDIVADTFKAVRQEELAVRGLRTDETLCIDRYELFNKSESEVLKTVVGTTATTKINTCYDQCTSSMNLDCKSDLNNVSISTETVLASEEVTNSEKDLIPSLKKTSRARSKIKELMPTTEISKNDLAQNSNSLENNGCETVTSKDYYEPDIDTLKNASHETVTSKNYQSPNLETSAKQSTSTVTELATRKISEIEDNRKKGKKTKKLQQKKIKKKSKNTNQSYALTKKTLKDLDPSTEIFSTIPPFRTTEKEIDMSLDNKRDYKHSEFSNKYDDTKDFASHKKYDVYEFKDNEEAELLEMRPSVLMDRCKSVNFKNKPKPSKRKLAAKETGDSTESTSDESDLVYLSDDFEHIDDEMKCIVTSEIENISCRKKTSGEYLVPLRKNKKNEKTAVMDKIFKHRAGRAETKYTKCVKTEKPQTDFDQLFDSLLRDAQAETVETQKNERDISSSEHKKYPSESSGEPQTKSRVSPEIYHNPTSKKEMKPCLTVSAITKWDSGHGTDRTSSTSKRVVERDRSNDLFNRNVQTDGETSSSTNHDRSNEYVSDDDIPDRFHEKSKRARKDKPSACERSPDARGPERDEAGSTSDGIGVGRERARRKCTVGKLNVLSETWSSESEADVGRRHGGGAGAPNDRRNERTRRRVSRRRRSGGTTRKRRDVSKECRRAAGTAHRCTTAHVVVGAGAGGPQSESNIHTAESMVMESPLPSPSPSPCAEQHGWIVGSSHKKLVTMLAQAKRRKRNATTETFEA